MLLFYIHTFSETLNIGVDSILSVLYLEDSVSYNAGLSGLWESRGRTQIESRWQTFRWTRSFRRYERKLIESLGAFQDRCAVLPHKQCDCDGREVTDLLELQDRPINVKVTSCLPFEKQKSTVRIRQISPDAHVQ